MKHILIVGANSGIGYYMVKQLLEDGKAVSVLDIKTDNLEELKGQYNDLINIIQADATDEESVKRGVKEAEAELGEIDIAVHNACICSFESEANTEYGVYEKVMNVNFYGALRLSKAVLPLMRARKRGKVIFTSSGVGVTGFGNISPYASSKGAIEALAKCLTMENEEYGISFHIMHPPLTNTDSSSGLPVPKEFMANPETVGRGLAKKIDSNRFVICHSAWQALQMKLCYRHPIRMGRMMWKMTTRAKQK